MRTFATETLKRLYVYNLGVGVQNLVIPCFSVDRLAGPQHGGGGEGGEGSQAAGNVWINSADEEKKKERVRLLTSLEAMRCGRVALLLLE
jgi:hypothetical protein